MQKIEIQTLFDITKTNIVRNYSPALVKSHPTINTKEEWVKARQQETNWETIIQVISLRSNPVDIKYPNVEKIDLKNFGYHMFFGLAWKFSFVIETDSVFHDGTNPIGLLLDDMNNVPMISGLNDNVVDCNYFKTNDAQTNVFITLK